MEDDITLGCEHGRPIGRMCPHCMGINNMEEKCRHMSGYGYGRLPNNPSPFFGT